MDHRTILTLPAAGLRRAKRGGERCCAGAFVLAVFGAAGCNIEATLWEPDADVVADASEPADARIDSDATTPSDSGHDASHEDGAPDGQAVDASDANGFDTAPPDAPKDFDAPSDTALADSATDTSGPVDAAPVDAPVDASGADASDATAPRDASEAGSSVDASDASNTVDASDAAQSVDAGPPGSDAGTDAGSDAADANSEDAGVDACVPDAAACGSFNCGSVDNGCGTELPCGACSGLETCGGGGTAQVCGLPDAGCVPIARYTITVVGTGVLGSGTGRVYDNTTEKTWMRVYYFDNAVNGEGTMATDCATFGMRIPNAGEAESIAGTGSWDSCAFPVGWDTWTSTPTGFEGLEWVDVSSGGGTGAANISNYKDVLCVSP